MRINSKGVIGPLEIVLIVLVIAAIGFVGWRVMGSGDSTTETDQSGDEVSEESGEWPFYESEEFGFSFDYPAEWGQPVEEILDYTGEEYEDVASGKFLVLTFSNYYEAIDQPIIHIAAATEDHSSTKGPAPISYNLNTGWISQSGKFRPKNGLESSALTEENFIESVEVTDFNPNLLYVVEGESPLGNKTYVYALSTQVGGATVSTEDPELLELLEDIARTLAAI